MILLLGLALVGCAPSPAGYQPAATQEPASTQASQNLTPTSGAVAVADPAQEASPTEPPALESTAAPLPAERSTPDPKRLPPEQWRDWPVVPDVTGRALDIYRAGLALDLNRHALSKIGDCQSIREVLLGMYDHPDRFSIPEDKPYLAETIQQFSGSFDRDGNAVKGGYNAAAVLSPLWADPKTCQPGETPLACELRTQRPVFALISLEVWWKGRTPERYEQYMRQIIEQLIANGTVPILSTKADNVEGDHAINLATARLAYEYDLPLWNWWRAAQALPNQGLDPTRPDGFHISIESWPERSLTALESVDALWRGLEGAVNSASAAEPTPTLAATTAPPAAATVEIQSLKLEIQKAPAALESSALVFDLYTEGGASQGIFSLALKDTAARRLAEPGWTLQAVSPDGRYLLANQGSRLALLEPGGAAAAELSADFASGALPAALFAPDGSAILWAEAGGGVSVLPLDGSPLRSLTFPAAGPIELLPAGENGVVYALAGSCTPAGACERGDLWRLPLNAAAPVQWDQIPAGVSFAVAPQGGRWAYEIPGQAGETGLALSAPGGSLRQLPISGESVSGLVWDGAGQRLSVLVAQRSGYSGKNFGSQHFIVTAQNLGTRQLPDLEGLSPRQAWSPDGQWLARAATLQVQDGYRLALDVVDLSGASVKLSPLAGSDPALFSSQFLYTGLIAWLP
jgi:hypothetical protein